MLYMLFSKFVPIISVWEFKWGQHRRKCARSRAGTHQRRGGDGLNVGPGTIYGLFPGPHAAERGMNALRAAGVAQEKIVVMSSEPFEEYSFRAGRTSTVMPWLAVCGGLSAAPGDSRSPGIRKTPIH